VANTDDQIIFLFTLSCNTPIFVTLPGISKFKNRSALNPHALRITTQYFWAGSQPISLQWFCVEVRRFLEIQFKCYQRHRKVISQWMEDCIS